MNLSISDVTLIPASVNIIPSSDPTPELEEDEEEEDDDDVVVV